MKDIKTIGGILTAIIEPVYTDAYLTIYKGGIITTLVQKDGKYLTVSSWGSKIMGEAGEPHELEGELKMYDKRTEKTEVSVAVAAIRSALAPYFK